MIWQTIFITFVAFALAMAGLAIGVIVSNKRLKGSCGGLGNLRDDQGKTLCEGCSTPSPDCLGDPTER